jgi:hypothetical protein
MTEFYLDIDSLSSKHGWMRCALVVNGVRHHLDATNVFPPFHDVLKFVRAVASNVLPHDFFWDEEGCGARWEATPVPSNPASFRLCINHNNEIVIDEEMDRMRVAESLLGSLRDFLAECPHAEDEWEFPAFLVQNFERDLARGFPPRTLPLPIHEAHFVFDTFYGVEDGVCPNVSMWINEEFRLQMNLTDTPRFWEMWFEFLENIAQNALPFEADFKAVKDELPDECDAFSMMFWGVSQRFIAEPATDRNLFQLKVEVTGVFPMKNTSLILDRAFDRRKFVGEFVDSFRSFMKETYPAILAASPEGRFDLHELPIDRLQNIDGRS